MRETAKPNLVSAGLHADNNVHHVAVTFVVSRHGVLYLKRAPNDNIEAGKWGIICGHIDKGENPLLAARRELSEEAGITSSHQRLEYLGSLRTRTWRTPANAQRSLIQAVAEVHCLIDYNLQASNIKISSEHTAYQLISIRRFLGLREEMRHAEMKTLNRSEGNVNDNSLRLTLADQEILNSPIFDVLIAKMSIAESKRKIH